MQCPHKLMLVTWWKSPVLVVLLQAVSHHEKPVRTVAITYSRYVLLTAILASCDSTYDASFALEMCCSARPNCHSKSYKLINYTLERSGGNHDDLSRVGESFTDKKKKKGNSKFQTSAEERVQSPKHGDESTVGTLTPTASHCRRVFM